MELGIFAKTFARAQFEDSFATAKHLGLECVQFNLSCAGLSTLPDVIAPALVRRIWSGLESNSLRMAAISGTCNLIHPDPAQRTRDLERLELLIRHCPGLGTSVVTLCTGTRDATDMWRAHFDNHSPEAWHDLLQAIEQLLPAAQRHGVALGIEPEPANVINSAARARRLLDELQSPFLKIIFDAANLLQAQTLNRQSAILSEAVDLLGPDILIAHAKDLTSQPGAGHVAAGRGALDYKLYLSLLQRAGFKGPVILHSLVESEVPAAVAFMRGRLNNLNHR